MAVTAEIPAHVIDDGVPFGVGGMIRAVLHVILVDFHILDPFLARIENGESDGVDALEIVAGDALGEH